MKKLFSFLLAIILLIPATVQARSWYGNMDIKGKIIMNTNDIDSAAHIDADTIAVTNTTMDTATVKQLLDMDTNPIVNIDWGNSDTDSLDADLLDNVEGNSYLRSDVEDTATRLNVSGILKAIGGLDMDDTGIINISWDDSDTDNLDADLIDGVQGDSILRSDIEDTFTKLNGDTIDAVLSGSVDCASDEYLRGDGTCSTDQQSVGASLVVQEDGTTVENQGDTINARRALTAETLSSGRVAFDAFLKNYLDPDGLTIGNADNTDIGIDLKQGGMVYADFVGSGDTEPRVVDVASSDTAFRIDQTGCGGLVNSSSRNSDQWYELAIAFDSDETNSPCLIGWTHTSDTDNTPTVVGDLPSGYDSLRAMGTPGKTWWVRTDGSSNILGFDHFSDGRYRWNNSTISGFGTLVADASPSTGSNNNVDASNQIPPTKLEIKINQAEISSDGATSRLGLAEYSMSDRTHAQSLHASGNTSGEKDGGEAVLHGVSDQNFNWRIDNTADRVDIRKISSFRAVN